MDYTERVKYYIRECHLDRYDAEREALEDMREHERTLIAEKITKDAMSGILKELKTIVDILPENELRKTFSHFESINKYMEILIENW